MSTTNLKDHREIGREQELFFTDDLAPGAPFWLPNGMVIFKELEKFIRKLTLEAGYQETSTPIMVKSEIFRQSGHWSKFGKNPFDELYNLSIWEEEDIEEITNLINNEISKLSGKDKDTLGKYFPATIFYKGQNVDLLISKSKAGYTPSLPVNYTLKPMNCPESTILYRFRQRSYKELPLRFSEIGRLHRREKSGEVHGLLRVRQLTMDDAHIFAQENKIEEEVANILDTMVKFYDIFGFEYEFKLATRPGERAGKDEDWDKAEKTLEDVLKKKKLKYSAKDRDGAFYGPKIDLHIKDSQEREWQLATVQIDFHMPSAFDLKYIDEQGQTQRPVMIHRAIFGSFERFIAIVTEQFQGSFPIWLAPKQTILLPISDKNLDYAKEVNEKLTAENIRSHVDIRNETLQAKIRDATLAKIPYMLVVGQREEDANEISVRTREGEDLGKMTIAAFIEKIKKDVASRA